MTDDLERLVQAAEGQGPSDDFRARLRAQIVAETEGRDADAGRGSVSVLDIGDETDDDLTVVLDMEAPRREGDEDENGDELAARRAAKQRQLLLLGAAAAVVVIAAIGIWSLLFDDDPSTDLDVIDDPATTTTTIEPPDDDLQGAPLTAGNTFFDAGTYRIDTLGTAFSITADKTLGMLLNENDIVLITHLTSATVDDRTIAFRRIPVLPDPTAATTDVDPDVGWPADDLAGWVDGLGNDVAATEPVRTALGGRDATLVELDFACADDTSCSAPLPSQALDIQIFTPGSRYRMWVVDQDGEDPIVVTVAIDDDADLAWFDEADSILDTLEFGEVAPNPLRRLPAGSVELAAFGGVTIELPNEAIVVEPFPGFARILPPGASDSGERGFGLDGDIELLTRPLDVDGVEVTTGERFEQLLREEAAFLTDRGTLDVGGAEARSYDIDSGGIPNVVLKARPDDLARAEFGWESPARGSLWIIEHPERGLLIVSTEVFSDPVEVDRLRPLAEQILRSLEFR